MKVSITKNGVFADGQEIKNEIVEVYMKALPPEYDEQLKVAYAQVSQYSRSELVRILKEFNDWNWPLVLGNPPVTNWDELPEYRRPWMPEGILCKKDFIKPYSDAILVLGVSYRDLRKL